MAVVDRHPGGLIAAYVATISSSAPRLYLEPVWAIDSAYTCDSLVLETAFFVCVMPLQGVLGHASFTDALSFVPVTYVFPESFNRFFFVASSARSLGVA
jgi:hypothetical protein